MEGSFLSVSLQKELLDQIQNRLNRIELSHWETQQLEEITSLGRPGVYVDKETFRLEHQVVVQFRTINGFF